MHTEEEPSQAPVEKIPPRVFVPFPQAMFAQNGCSSCHGDSGEGRGSQNGLPDSILMPNFQDVRSFRHGSDKASIIRSIQYGIPGTYMKSYSHLRRTEIEALAEQIIRLRKTNPSF
ncbi:MAG: c-type cytochrome [Leptospira sp.]|nr:c-type cytochrome [Leptospira sp.]